MNNGFRDYDMREDEDSPIDISEDSVVCDDSYGNSEEVGDQDFRPYRPIPLKAKQANRKSKK